MRKLHRAYFLFTLLFGVIFQLKLSAQNLVLNPSFESYTSCPQSISQFDKAVNWRNPFINLPGDTCSTSDLYNSCSTIGGAGVPQNILGNQVAHTGIGYAGIILYDGFPILIFGCDNIPTGWREYAEGTLSSPLIAGRTYCVSFYVSLADNVKFATDDIGVYFSNSLVSVSCATVGTSSVLPYTPQLQYIGAAIADTSTWTKLQWTYTANGGEQYFIIGNFKNDANTTYVCVNGNSINSHAYYYIDDVEVTADVCCPDINIASITSVACNGASNGSATVAPSGGVPPYSYAWSGGGTGATISNRPAGNYTVSVSDSRGCLVTKIITITQPAPLSVSLNTFSSSCGNSVTATPTGGTSPFTYSWSNGSTGASIANLAAGSYAVTLVDGGNCTVTNSVSVTQTGGFGVNSSANNSGCTVCTGTATASVSGGTPPYSYLWSDGQTTSTATSLCPGTYTATVTESSSGSGNIFFTENFTSATGWTLNISGPGANGPEANAWVINNNRSNCTQCPVAGSGGNYLHITCTSLVPCTFSGDAGSCIYDTGVPGFSNPTTDKYVASPNISTIGKTGITLSFWYMVGGEAGADYGQVRLSANGGSSWTDLPTQYLVTTTCTQAVITIPATYENLPDFRIGFRWVNNNNFDGDDLAFLIDDIELSAAGGSSSCTAVVSVVINSISGPVVSLGGQTDVTCNGNNNGTVNINVSGGTMPYTYNWTGGATTEDISGLNGGNYSVTVADNNSCSATLNTTINEPDALAVAGSVTDPGCTQAGAIDLTINGGTIPYRYAWTNGATTQNLGNIQGGAYSVTVLDANGCSSSSSFTVNSTANVPVISLTPTAALCNGVANGSINSNITGGTSPFQYVWSNGSTTSNLPAVAGGTYSVTANDNNGCTTSLSATVSAPNSMVSFASITRVLCDINSNGGIKLILGGGTSPYSVLWNNGATTESISDLAPGIYSATVTDSNGCLYDTTISLTSVSTLSIEASATNASCDGSTSGSVQAVILSGNASPFSYQWSTGATSSSISNVLPGIYSVTVVDSLSCPKNDSAVVYKAGLEIEELIQDVSCPDSSNGFISVTVFGGVPPYIYSWDNGQSTASIYNIAVGTYSLVVSDNEDCSGIDTFTVAVDPDGINCEKDSLTIYNVFSPNGDGRNDFWVIDGLEKYAENEMQIFNRWGNLVFEASPYINSWDGYSKKGNQLPVATYYYILKLNNAAETIYSGHITIIR